MLQLTETSWIGKFVKYVDPLPTPDIFKLWAGISCVMGALERRVWCRTMGTNVYPNHYVLLVAPPGVGKSVVIAAVTELWCSTGVLKIAPDSATKAAMVDELVASSKSFTHKGDIVIYHALNVASSEFGNLIPAYDHATMNFYNTIWDCKKKHSERLRYGDKKIIDIDFPCINMLAGTQPSYLGALLPPDAFGMGFTARLMLVYSAEAVRPSLFDEKSEPDIKLYKQLAKDLKRITELCGQMKWSQGAMDLMEKWYAANDDAPTHPRLLVYSVRRGLIAQKLATVFACAENSNMLIEEHHVRDTITIMQKTEALMPEIFKGMNIPETSEVMAELQNYMITAYNRNGRKPLPEYLLIDFLKNRVEIHKVDPIMKHMLTSGAMEEAPSSTIADGKFVILGKQYIPKGLMQ